jgi:hypothetical protein
MRTLLALAAVLTASLALAACGGGSGSTTVNGEQVVTGPQISATPPPWPANYTQLARRARLRGIPDPGSEKFHWHEQLRIYRDGLLIDIPSLIGLDIKNKVAVGVHTHEDTPGVIHMEADKPFQATLGDFFAIWGVKFGGGWLGGLHAEGDDKLRTFVNGREITDPAAYVLHRNDNIVVAFGSTNDFPRRPDTTEMQKANGQKGGSSCSLNKSSGKRPKSCVMELFKKKS